MGIYPPGVDVSSGGIVSGAYGGVKRAKFLEFVVSSIDKADNQVVEVCAGQTGVKESPRSF
jgi:hypothetical protein